MKLVALVDFGSTFTKVALVERGAGRLVAHAQSPTTVDTDVMEGYAAALEAATSGVQGCAQVTRTLAASSAGGGLRMAAAGLVEDLTATAARQAALNAGAKVELVLAGVLDGESRRALEGVAPEILLFAGGTDGGQRARVLANAEVLAGADAAPNVIVACNRDVAATVAGLFRRGGRRVQVVDNVMPSVATLDIEPARGAIHGLFIDHVIRGKGLSRAEAFDSSVLMPTPEAVLAATGILADGMRKGGGLGDVVVIDVGGATTDVHSTTGDDSVSALAHDRLLPLPPILRTVQGDLGMRWSAPTTLAADREWLEDRLGGRDASEMDHACDRRHMNPAFVPDDPCERAIDRALAVSCVAHALRRHCGALGVRSRGESVVTRIEGGPDLRRADVVVGTGGALIHDPDATDVLARALARREERVLAPLAPSLAIDRSYVLAAAGLLATEEPGSALRLLLSEIPGVQRAA